MANKHPGFKAVAAGISKKEGYSPKVAAKIVASASRKAVANGSKNPALKKVKGK